ncbi:hypothetical protein K435DRAFT_865044 [Dendrothele bispora CBS 962.96]|uniref:DUF7918 domain-containing protein n=1 Tax=Dendrothele bispora (strain CBS 962.96) TaxID=1314807 RepID=A0A4V6T588_DENBC|nr:hypothetical protein K435DRAFT_865044 [Dendrothele bispora CBS 962.96]
MLTLGDFSTWIEVDDLPLQEYDIKIKDSEVTCWIPSEVGKNFRVRWTIQTDFCVAIDVYLDGQLSVSKLRKAWPGKTEGGTDGIYTSPTSQKPFLFSRLDLTDDDAYLDTSHTQIGEIKVVFDEAVVVSHDTGFTPSDFKELGKVHERSKKVVGHQIGLGKEKQIPYEQFSSFRTLRTLATMIFRYRPIAILRANGLAPPAEPQIGEKRPAASDEVLDLTLSDDEKDKDDEEEIEALETRLAALRNKRRRIKVENEPGVKAEPGTVSIKKEKTREQVTQLGHSDIIDLT